MLVGNVGAGVVNGGGRVTVVLSVKSQYKFRIAKNDTIPSLTLNEGFKHVFDVTSCKMEPLFSFLLLFKFMSEIIWADTELINPTRTLWRGEM